MEAAFIDIGLEQIVKLDQAIGNIGGIAPYIRGLRQHIRWRDPALLKIFGKTEGRQKQALNMTKCILLWRQRTNRDHAQHRISDQQFRDPVFPVTLIGNLVDKQP